MSRRPGAPRPPATRGEDVGGDGVERATIQTIEEQSVVTARFAFNALVTVSATALLFLLSPRDAPPQEKALRELETLISLDVESLLLNAALEDERALQYRKRLSDLVSPLGFEFEPRIQANALLEILPIPPSVTDGNLETIAGELSGITSLRVTLTNLDEEGMGEFRDFIQKIARDFQGRMTDNRIRLSLQASGNEWSPVFGIGTAGYQGAPLAEAPERESFTIPFDLVSHLRSSPRTAHLVQNVGERELLFLPALHDVWNEIRTESPIQARAVLARQKVEPQKLEVFGLAIRESIVTSAVPILTLAISLYLLAHLYHLQGMARSNPDLRSYPWIAIMPGHVAATVSLAALLVLPLTSLVLAAIRSMNESGFADGIATIAASVVATACLVMCWLVTRRIRTTSE